MLKHKHVLLLASVAASGTNQLYRKRCADILTDMANGYVSKYEETRSDALRLRFDLTAIVTGAWVTLPWAVPLKRDFYMEKECIRVHIEDQGQDFTYFDIEIGEWIDPEYEGKIIGCGMFQSAIWVGKEVRSTFDVGAEIDYRDGDGARTLNYTVTSVELLGIYKFSTTVAVDENVVAEWCVANRVETDWQGVGRQGVQLIPSFWVPEAVELMSGMEPGGGYELSGLVGADVYARINKTEVPA